MHLRLPLSASAVALGLSCLGLSGCGDVSGFSSATAAGLAANVGLQGHVHGGSQPIGGSKIYLYAAGTSGYAQGATLVLGAPGYVITDATGGFTVTSDYTCPSPTSQMYLVATGGNTGAGVNPSSTLMAALGDCQSLSASTFINMNEVTSVASAYALAGFMKPGSTAVGTSSTNLTGLRNAFSTVANLTDLAHGVALSSTPSGNGLVPQNRIHSLANIMSACVNSTGGSGPCASLFALATSATGVAPTDTLSAMLNVAQNPGRNVSALFQVSSGMPTFQPSLSGAPSDWTLSLEYTGAGLNTPQLPAVDAQGNVWVPNANDQGSLSELSPTGVPLSGTSGYTGGGLSNPYAVAIDLNGNAWTANQGLNNAVPGQSLYSNVSAHTSAGSPLSGPNGFTVAGMARPAAIAVDANGNIFTANANNSVTKLTSSGAFAAQLVNGGLGTPFSVAIDGAQNVWVSNVSGPSVSKFSNSGTAASSVGYTGGGLASPYWIALDANGNAWVANFDAPTVSKLDASGNPLSGSGFATANLTSSLAVDGDNTIWTANEDGSISRLANDGTAISPAGGYTAPGATAEIGVVIDGSGNVWTTDVFATGSLFQYVGAAAPTTVPLAAAVQNHTMGIRP